MWWFLTFTALTCGGGILGHYHFQSKRLKDWRKLVESCGLQVVKASSAAALLLRLEARGGPVSVRIRDTRKATRLLVAFPGPPGFAGVRIRREEHRLPGAREIEIGDDLFDGKFYVEGPARLLSVLLDGETRGLLLTANTGGELEIFRSEIRKEMPSLPDVLPLLLEIARRLSQQVEVAQRLAENARHDSEAGVRLRNLLLLAREFPGEPVTLEALRAACSDPLPQIRLRAAMELGAEARDLLLEFAESTESAVDDALSAQAVARLGRELPFERTNAILGRALRKRRLQTARACLEVLGASGETAAVDTLAKVLAVERGELATAAALALGATGSPDAEPALLPALQRERADVRVAAATALGRVGSPAAVLPLKEVAESSRDQELRRATRQAIAEIQSRLQGATPGQLSLAGAEAGQLSMPDAETGQLSLATDPAGQLSLPPEEPGGLPASSIDGHLNGSS